MLRTRVAGNLLPIGVLALIVLAVAVIAASPAGASASPASLDDGVVQAQTTLNPSAMTWVSSAMPDQNFGGEGHLWAGLGTGPGSTAGIMRGYVQFPDVVLPPGATLTSARLNATIIGAQGDPDTFKYYACRSSSSWTEGGMTWNQPQSGHCAIYTDISATEGAVSWDVTPIVADWISGAFPRNGFNIRREHDDSDPQPHARVFGSLTLTVNFSLPTRTPTPLVRLIEVSVRDAADPVCAGSEIDYTISVVNLTGVAISGITVVDRIPLGTAFVEASNGGSFDGDRSVTWQSPTILAHGTQNLNLTVRTAAVVPNGTTLTNNVTAAVVSGTAKRTTYRVSGSTTTHVLACTPTPTATPSCRADEAGDTWNAATDIALGPVGVCAFLCQAGDEDWWKFQVNAGESIDGLLWGLPENYAAQLVRPDGVPQFSFDATGTENEKIVYARVPANQAGEWRVRVYNPRGVYSDRIYHLTMQSLAPTPTVTRTATRTRTVTRTRTATRTTTPTRTPYPAPVLTVDATLNAQLPVYRDTVIEYLIDVENPGAQQVNSVVLTADLPEGVTYISAYITPASVIGSRLTWPSMPITAGGSWRYGVTVHVGSEVPDGTVLHFATSAMAGPVYQDRADVNTTVAAPPAVRLVSHAVQDEAIPGQWVEFHVSAVRAGTVGTNELIMTDLLPSNVTEWEANGDYTYDDATRTLTWPGFVIPSWSVSQEYSVRVKVPLDAPDGQFIENTAYLDQVGMDRMSVVAQVPISNPMDLTVERLEFNQAVQNRANTIPLVQGKPLAVRAYIGTNNSGPVAGVTGKLEVIRNGVVVDIVEPSNSNGDIVAPVEPNPENKADTLNFYVAGDYCLGAVQFRVTVNPDRTIEESQYSNNSLASYVDFVYQPSIRIGYVPIHYSPPGYTGPTDPSARIADADRFLKWVYPIAPGDVVYFPLPPITYTKDVNAFMGPENLLAVLDDIQADCNCDHVYGWLPANVFGGNGAAWVGGNTSFGNDTDDKYRRTMAHEIGHNLGAGHVDTTLAEGQEVGFNPATYEIKVRRPDGGMLMDVMVPAQPETNAWSTPYLYDIILDNLSAQAEATLTAAGEYLYVTGIVGNSGGGTLRPIWRVTRDTPTLPQGTRYTLSVEDGAGATLASYPFDVSFEGDDPTPRENAPFKLVVPWVAGIARVVLLEGASELDSRSASATTPTVEVLTPVAGDVWSGAHTVTWTGNDADGDELYYRVLYSNDNGATWLGVSPVITETSYVLDTTALAGGAECLVRVRVSDSMRNSHADSAAFQVPGKAPSASIEEPQDGALLTQGRRAHFQGKAWDLEDGRLPSTSFSWSSSLDGALGTGYALTTTQLSLGVHQISLTVTDSDGFTGSDTITVTVSAPPSAECVQALVNGGFESGDLTGWQRGGVPAPIVSHNAAYTGSVGALDPVSEHGLWLGNPTELAGRAGVSFVRQYVYIPEDVGEATLSFWFRVRTSDPRPDYDWFAAFVLDPLGNASRQIIRVASNTEWQRYRVNLLEYRGQTIGIGFQVRNDGQAGVTWAQVDNVLLCISGGDPAAPLPEEAGSYRYSGGLADYAPSGMPDFAQQQEDWKTPSTAQWSHDGPVAAADMLWWLDSKAEPESDASRLVESYDSWDDHDPRNVFPLVGDLAARVDVNGDHRGTDLDNLVSGLTSYIADRGLTGQTALMTRRSPSFDWVRDQASQGQPVVLLLGFWQLQPGGWKRVGGHYVSLAGVGSSAEWLAFSDPFRNAAEAGWAGRVLPAGGHAHTGTAPDAVHNDAAYVSHDRYAVQRSSLGWGPAGYAATLDDVANFCGLNSAPALDPALAEANPGGEIVTVVDYAIALAWAPSSGVELALSPGTNSVRAGQAFRVWIEVNAGEQPVDGVASYLSFDPTKVRVVNEDLSPASAIVPGPALATVTHNAVNNAAGTIDYVAGGSAVTGRVTLASILFRAITTTTGVNIVWSGTEPRRSDLTLGGASVLTRAQSAQVIIAPGATLAGEVELQGRPTPPDSSWSVPVMVTMSQPGERGAAYVYVITTTQTGEFSVPAVVAPGGYRIRIAGLHTLRNLKPEALTGGANDVDMGTLIEGDVVSDNRVDIRDASALAAAYGKSSGQPGFSARADLNEDNAIDSADLELLRANMGRRGDVLVGVAPSAEDTADLWDDVSTSGLSVATGAGVTLRIVPSTTRSTIDGVIVLDVVADAGAQPVSAIALYLDFDPALLEVVDESGEPAVGIEAGTSLPIIFTNNVDGANGRIDFVASSVGSEAPSGPFTVARVRVKALASGNAWVRFSFSDWRTTGASDQGQDVLGDVEAASVLITGPARLWFPVVWR